MTPHARQILFVALIGFLATVPLAGQDQLAPIPTPLTATIIIVRQTDLDQNAHVNNARYIEYLQCGRWDWFEKHELSRKRLVELRAIPVVVNLNVDFRKECGDGERLSVLTHAKRGSDKTFIFRQEIRKADGTIAADAVVTLVAFDPVARRSREIPEELRRLLP